MEEPALPAPAPAGRQSMSVLGCGQARLPSSQAHGGAGQTGQALRKRSNSVDDQRFSACIRLIVELAIVVLKLVRLCVACERRFSSATASTSESASLGRPLDAS